MIDNAFFIEKIGKRRVSLSTKNIHTEEIKGEIRDQIEHSPGGKIY